MLSKLIQNKAMRLTTSFVCVFIGIVFAIIPGSILFLLFGLALLSVDFPLAKKWLRKSQRAMSNGASKLDRFLAARR